jgi:hypothetical protein
VGYEAPTTIQTPDTNTDTDNNLRK